MEGAYWSIIYVMAQPSTKNYSFDHVRPHDYRKNDANYPMGRCHRMRKARRASNSAAWMIGTRQPDLPILKMLQVVRL